MTAPAAVLRRYRVMAYVVGVMLLVLTFVAIPLRLFADVEEVSKIVSPVHGLLFMVYLVTVYQLGRTFALPLSRQLLLALAGCVPFLSFVFERREARRLAPAAATAGEPAPAPTA